MTYFITDRSGRLHKFGNWTNAIRFAIQEAKRSPLTPIRMSSGLVQYQIWSDGEIDRLETYCACDTCKFCSSPNGSAACPCYWEQQVWEHYDTYKE